jgi:hypothetical protein
MHEQITVERVDIIFHKEDNYLEMCWQKHTSSKAYREACMAVLDMLRKYPVHTILYDQRNMGIISVTDTKWTYEYFYSTYMEIVGRHQKSAVVLSSNVFGEFSVKSLVDGIQKNKNTDEDVIVNQYFKDKEEAIKWLIAD